MFARGDTKVRGRSCEALWSPSRRSARNASAALKNFVRQPKKTFSTLSASTGHTGPCCCMYADGGILLNQKRLCVDLVHEDEWNSMRCFAFYGTGNLARRFRRAHACQAF